MAYPGILFLRKAYNQISRIGAERQNIRFDTRAIPTLTTQRVTRTQPSGYIKIRTGATNKIGRRDRARITVPSTYAHGVGPNLRTPIIISPTS